jgi:hypothetical protein
VLALAQVQKTVHRDPIDRIELEVTHSTDPADEALFLGRMILTAAGFVSLSRVQPAQSNRRFEIGRPGAG